MTTNAIEGDHRSGGTYHRRRRRRRQPSWASSSKTAVTLPHFSIDILATVIVLCGMDRVISVSRRPLLRVLMLGVLVHATTSGLLAHVV